MLKLTKKADYGLIALRHLATARRSTSAKDIADAYRIPVPPFPRSYRAWCVPGCWSRNRGTNGGYRLARDPHEITALEVIRTIDGPIILTHCFTEHAECDQSNLCPVREPLRKVHEGILRLLSSITISDMSNDDMPIPQIPTVISGIQPTRT